MYIQMMQTEALCEHYGVLPSELEKEKAEDINMMMAILSGRATREEQEAVLSQNMARRMNG